MLRQTGNLRVVLKRGDTYALLLMARVENEDLYYSIHEDSQWAMLRSSYHRTGSRHTYVDDGRHRVVDPVRCPLAEFKGVERLWGISMEPGTFSWTYQPTPDLSRRRNLIVDLEAAPALWGVDLYLVEKDRQDLAEQLLATYTHERQILSHVRLDWTTPWIYAVAWGVAEDKLHLMLDALPKQRGGKLGSIISGGPPSKEPPKRVLFPYVGGPHRPLKED